MQELQIGDLKIKLYSSSEDLPIKRYVKFQKYLLIDSGVGSDIEAIGGHFAKLFEYQTHNLTEQALQETKNLYYNFYLIISEVSALGYSFCCLIHSINDEEITDFSEENLAVLLERINKAKASQKEIAEKVSAIKKKIQSELKLYAPNFFNEDESLRFYQLVKSKITLLSERYDKDDEESKALIMQIERSFAEFCPPQNFDSGSRDNATIALEINFESHLKIAFGN